MNLSQPLPEEGVAIPLFATFTGVKFAPQLALATNSFSPKLRFYNDDIEFKVIRTHRKSYDEIECVRTLPTLFTKSTRSLDFLWRETPLTLTVHVVQENFLIQVLYFLQHKNVALSPQAQALLDEKNPK